MKQEAKEKQKKHFLLKDHQDVIELIYMQEDKIDKN